MAFAFFAGCTERSPEDATRDAAPGTYTFFTRVARALQTISLIGFAYNRTGATYRNFASAAVHPPTSVEGGSYMGRLSSWESGTTLEEYRFRVGQPLSWVCSNLIPDTQDY
jgi:hypothetical protein